jgi:hypothetical protein
MKPLTILSGALVRTLNSVNQARNQVGSLHLYTSPADPDIHDRVTDAYNRVAQAEGILEALRDDLDVWSKEEDHA